MLLDCSIFDHRSTVVVVPHIGPAPVRVITRVVPKYPPTSPFFAAASPFIAAASPFIGLDQRYNRSPFVRYHRRQLHHESAIAMHKDARFWTFISIDVVISRRPLIHIANIIGAHLLKQRIIGNVGTFELRYNIVVCHLGCARIIRYIYIDVLYILLYTHYYPVV